MEFPDRLYVEDFVVYSSPRYFRLVFPDLKPRTKNGDLINAMHGLIRRGILSRDSSWDRIRTTKLGNAYRRLIKKLMDMGALYNERSGGLFDYRSEPGRKAIVNLIEFFSAKFEFNRKMFKKITRKQNVIPFSLTIVKKLLAEFGINRPEPLFNHFNNCRDLCPFFIKNRLFYVNYPDLIKIQGVLAEYLADFMEDETRWLSVYFGMLKMPTSLFGFGKSGMSYLSGDFPEEVDNFLKIAIEAPGILASRYGIIPGLGRPHLIVFPLDSRIAFIIYNYEQGPVFYFTLDKSKLVYKQTCRIIDDSDIPAYFRTSRRRFGKLFSFSYTLSISSNEEDENGLEYGNGPGCDKSGDESESISVSDGSSTVERLLKELEDSVLPFRNRDGKNDGGSPGTQGEVSSGPTTGDVKKTLKKIMNELSYTSAALFDVCKSIADKLNPGFTINGVHCIFSGGCVDIMRLTSDTLITAIRRGTIEFGPELKNILKKIGDSISIIFGDENIAVPGRNGKP